MIKKITLLLALTFVVAGAFAQPLRIAISKPENAVKFRKKQATTPALKSKTAKKHTLTPTVKSTELEGIPTAVLLAEDFSKFTAGTEDTPDGVRLDNEDGIIDDSYFHTPGWGGTEIYQAGGAAYVGFSKIYGETGTLISPTINLSGLVKITLRARSANPKGDYFNYNIVDASIDEVVDANYMYISNQWTDIELTTTYGTENAFFYFFVEQSHVFFDDIRIESAQLEAPILHEETNLTATGFTASWEPVNGAELYDVYAEADHTVGADGLCVWADLDFEGIHQGGTESQPLIDQENEGVFVDQLSPNNYPGWYLFMPAYADGMVAVSGMYAAYEYFGYLQSPELNLSGNRGEVSLTMRIKAEAGERLAVAMVSPTVEGGYGFVDSKAFEATGQWQNIDVTISGGTTSSFIQIVYGGSNVMLIDDVKLTQQLPEGTVRTHRFMEASTHETSHAITVPTIYHADPIYYAVRSVKEIWEEYDGQLYLVDALESPYTEKRLVSLPTSIAHLPLSPSKNATTYDLQGRRVSNTTHLKGVYIVNGKKHIR